MKIVCTSDFHGIYPAADELPEGDVLVIAGDTGFLELGSTRSVLGFQAAVAFANGWLEAVRLNGGYKAVLGIAGNHDWTMQEDPELAASLAWTYLVDESVVIDGVKFHGAPWSNQFLNWAFMGTDAQLAERWALIPDDADVVIVHGPAYGVNDLAQGRVHTGSATLRERIVQVRPKLLVTGHIHEGRGIDQLGQTICINPSYVDASYRHGYAPIVHELAA